MLSFIGEKLDSIISTAKKIKNEGISNGLKKTLIAIGILIFAALVFFTIFGFKRAAKLSAELEGNQSIITEFRNRVAELELAVSTAEKTISGLTASLITTGNYITELELRVAEERELIGEIEQQLAGERDHYSKLEFNNSELTRRLEQERAAYTELEQQYARERKYYSELEQAVASLTRVLSQSGTSIEQIEEQISIIGRINDSITGLSRGNNETGQEENN